MQRGCGSGQPRRMLHGMRQAPLPQMRHTACPLARPPGRRSRPALFPCAPIPPSSLCPPAAPSSRPPGPLQAPDHRPDRPGPQQQQPWRTPARTRRRSSASSVPPARSSSAVSGAVPGLFCGVSPSLWRAQGPWTRGVAPYGTGSLDRRSLERQGSSPGPGGVAAQVPSCPGPLAATHAPTPPF